MTLTAEREKEIRLKLTAFKHWQIHEENPNDYDETHGPDMEELLAEIDELRRMVKNSLNDTLEVIKDLDVAIEALEYCAADTWECMSNSTGMVQSGPTQSATVAQDALNEIKEGDQ